MTHTRETEPPPKSFLWLPPTAQGVSLTAGTFVASKDAFTCRVFTTAVQEEKSVDHHGWEINYSSCPCCVGLFCLISSAHLRPVYMAPYSTPTPPEKSLSRMLSCRNWSYCSICCRWRPSATCQFLSLSSGKITTQIFLVG